MNFKRINFKIIIRLGTAHLQIFLMQFDRGDGSENFRNRCEKIGTRHNLIYIDLPQIKNCLASCTHITNNSRANAPTGSAGEESVSWCWVVVVVVVVVDVDVVDVVDVVVVVVDDVVDVVVVVVVAVAVAVVVAVAVAQCFVGTHARALNTPPNTDSFGARARACAARARTCAERRFGSPQTKPKPWYLRCFCSKRENKN